MKTELIFLDASLAGNMNGVTRCVQVLVDSFSKEKDYHVMWLHFEVTQAVKDVQVTNMTYGGYLQVVISMPSRSSSSLLNSAQSSPMAKAYQFIKSDLCEASRIILHVHTLNLIHFALFIRDHHPCHIITHLHCIPWKALYNSDNHRFLVLFENYHITNGKTKREDYVFREFEHLCYTRSDRILCVTRYASDFIRGMYPDNPPAVDVIYNGIEDIMSDDLSFRLTVHQPVRCLFVGNAHPSKGLEYILRSLESLRMRHEITLYVVGSIPVRQQTELESKHPSLDIRFIGNLSFIQLREYYLSSDIGLIASMQEQCSYVAIEMMMFGLPVVTTDVDGLHELFPTGHVACRVPLLYTPGKTLCPDILKMAAAISNLIENPEKRMQMAQRARRRYKRYYTEGRMVRSIKEVYNSL